MKVKELKDGSIVWYKNTIFGIKGEAYPCEGNVFRDSYEEKKMKL